VYVHDATKDSFIDEYLQSYVCILVILANYLLYELFNRSYISPNLTKLYSERIKKEFAKNLQRIAKLPKFPIFPILMCVDYVLLILYIFFYTLKDRKMHLLKNYKYRQKEIKIYYQV